MLTEARMQPTELQELPAGGSDPTRFDWREAWYPIFYVDDLDRDNLMRFTLLARDLVIWWDKNAECWRAFDDQCPHRLVPLSEGRINEAGLLECPYHGWAFRGDGRCDRIPQQDPEVNAQDSKRACASSLPTAIRQGLLFVYAGQPENAPHVKIPITEPLEETPDEWVCLNTFRDLPYDALTLLENVLDVSHVPFTHHRSVSNRANATTMDLKVLAAGKQGFAGYWAEGPRKGTLGPQNTTFVAPALMWHDVDSEKLGRTMTVVYATPVRKGECRIFARFPFKFKSKVPAFFIKLTPRWFNHLQQNTILEDDQFFLHYQEKYLSAKGGAADYAKAFYLATRSDAFVTALREWVNDYEAEPFAGEALPSRLSMDALMERYHSHTQHCSSCSTALTNLKRLRLGLAIAAFTSLALCPTMVAIAGQPSWPIALVSTVLPLMAGGLWLWLGGWERKFYQGEGKPLRNQPEKSPN
ncbi:MAG: Rieske 2Fe-2S domain-containing protein [Leptolyngbyaceae cyanobacterium bins.349]|nr:Rieske 2Fe-2S domain-containing protein [Leptolyngbyaceae cyanobacterium bins.349]